MKKIYFNDWISISRENVERFGKIPLPAGVSKIYLRKTSDFEPNKVSYLMYMDQLINNQKKTTALGTISATWRYLSPYCKKKDGQIEQIAVTIANHNVASLKLSESLVGKEEQMEIMNPQIMPDGEKQFIPVGACFQVLNIRQAIAEMEKRFPLKVNLQQRLLNQMGRA